jgi:hypothetical protein
MDDRPQVSLKVKALLAATVTGLVELALVRYVVLPMLAEGLSPNQVQWLREAFVTHPIWALLAILALAIGLSVPVLLVALRVSRLGPWRGGSTRTSQ